ncbi:MAG: MFS transporter [Aliidongia sp.]
MRIPPRSLAFTLLLGFLVAMPSFGIDMSLPALTATAAALHVAPAQAGLTMSLFMLGFGLAPLLYGPASDRYGRKPVIVFACLLFIIAGIGCALAPSLSDLLAWRVVQGAGAGASDTIALAIVRDLFEGEAARTKLSYVTIAMMVVPMLAPTVGAALLGLVGWRGIHAVLAGIGLLLLLAISFGFAESARLDPANRMVPSVVAPQLSAGPDPSARARLYSGQCRRLRRALRLCQRLAALSDRHRGTAAQTLWPGVRGDLARHHGGRFCEQPSERPRRRARLSARRRPRARRAYHHV